MSNRTPWTIDSIFRAFLALLGIVAFLWLLTRLSQVLIPFVIAFMVAYILNPVVNLFERRVRSRIVAVSLTLLCVATLLGGSAYLVISPLKEQMSHAAELLQRAVSDVNFSETISHRLPAPVWAYVQSQFSQDKLIGLLQNQEVLKGVGLGISTIAPGAFSIVTGTLNVVLWLLGLTVILMYMFFMLLDFEGISAELLQLIPPKYSKDVLGFLGQFSLAMSGYFRAQALISSILAVVFAVGFSIVGLPLGIVFGVMVGVATMVPYLQLATLPVAALLALLQSVDHGVPFWQVIGPTLLVYGVAEILNDALLVPRIQGKSSGLSPVMMMLSLSVWSQLLGFLGLIVAIPFTCLVLAYYRRLLERQGPGVVIKE